MPKNIVKTVPINKSVFMYILKAKKSSIRKLGGEPSIQCSEKTIRRELNTHGGLREQYLDRIAKHLNVDPRLLSGELVKEAFKTDDATWRRLYLQPLFHLEQYPYFRKEQEALHKEAMEETLKRILSLYEVSYAQFLEKKFDDQYAFQYDLFTAILPVMHKHFDKDGYGRDGYDSFDRILLELESFQEYHDMTEYANMTLRPYYSQHPPIGYSIKDIKRMTTDELFELDEMVHNKV